MKTYKWDQCDQSFGTDKGVTIRIEKTYKDTIPQLNRHTEKIADDETVHACNVEKHDVKERVKSPRDIEHLKRFGKIDYDFWCYDCDEEYESRLGFKRHMPNKHSKTVFEEIDITKHGWD